MTTLLENLAANIHFVGFALLLLSIRLIPLTINSVKVARKKYAHLAGLNTTLANERSDKVIMSYAGAIGNLVLLAVSLQFISNIFA